MAISDIDKLINNAGHFTVAQKNTLLKCFAEAVGIDSGLLSSVASPNDTIDVSITDGEANVDINGKPPGDHTNDLGTAILRWKDVFLRQNDSSGSKLKWVNDANNSTTSINYNLQTGPSFSNDTTGDSLTFDQSNLTTTRTATWQDSDGTVAWLGDILDYTNLYAGPSLVTINHTSGGLFVSGLGLPAIVFVTSDNAGTISATTTIDSQSPGDLTGGWELVVTFLVASTTVAHGTSFTSTNAKTLPTSASANQTFRYIWDGGVSKWKYYQ